MWKSIVSSSARSETMSDHRIKPFLNSLCEQSSFGLVIKYICPSLSQTKMDFGTMWLKNLVTYWVCHAFALTRWIKPDDEQYYEKCSCSVEHFEVILARSGFYSKGLVHADLLQGMNGSLILMLYGFVSINADTKYFFLEWTSKDGKQVYQVHNHKCYYAETLTTSHPCSHAWRQDANN